MATQNNDTQVSDPAGWLDQHGDYLFSFAVARLRNEDAAEEVVQQTLFSAYKAIEQYSGQGAFRAWLTGILKRKIIDYYRTQSRNRTTPLEDGPDISEHLFDEKGKWKRDPRIFGNDPGAGIESEEFWSVFQGCLDKLPEKQGSVFFLREVDKESAERICDVLQITSANLWVLLHRARLGLARCLKVNWDSNLGGEQHA